jgi:hypothetical protein
MRVTSKTNRGIDEPFDQKVVFSLLTVRSFRLGISSLSIRSNESCKSSFVRLGLLVLSTVSFCLVNAIRNSTMGTTILWLPCRSQVRVKEER